MVMSEEEWYGSAEHFNTEMSYEDYLKKLNNSGLKTPTFKELMKS